MMMVEVEIEVEVDNSQIESNKNIKSLNKHKVSRTAQCVFNPLSAGGPDTQRDRQTDRQIDKQIDRQTDTQR